MMSFEACQFVKDASSVEKCLSTDPIEHVMSTNEDVIGKKVTLQVQHCFTDYYIYFFFNVDSAMHFIYSHKYNTSSAVDSSDMN